MESACLFCSVDAVERKVIERKKKLNQPLIPTRLFAKEEMLQCCKCRRCQCKFCLDELLLRIPSSLQEDDQWCKDATAFLDDDDTTTDLSYHVCAMCKYQQQKPQKPNKGRRKRKRSNDDIDRVPQPPTIQERVARFKNSKGGTTFLHGMLYYPEFNLFIDNSEEGHLDVHALTKSKYGAQSVWHCVVPLESALDFAERKVEPKRLKPNRKGLEHEKVSVVVQGETIVVNIYYIEQQRDVNGDELKGTLRITDAEVPQSSVFEFDPDEAVTILVGKQYDLSKRPEPHMGRMDDPLLLMRFRDNLQSLKLNNNDMSSIYSTCLDKLRPIHGGYVCKRFGGSSGETRLDKDFFEFLTVPNSFPKKAGRVKMFRSRLEWVCFCKSNEDGNMKQVNYTPPVPGGHFKPTNDIMGKHEIFCHMTAMKYKAACILSKLHHPIGKEAYMTELRIWEPVVNSSATFEEAVRIMTKTCNFTVVNHSVGYHCDKFFKS